MVMLNVKKSYIIWLTFFLMIAFVVSYGTNNPAEFGHSSGEIDVVVDGSTYTLQDAITLGLFSPSVSGGLQSTTGRLEFTHADFEGSSEFCHFKFFVDNSPAYPPYDCSGTDCLKTSVSTGGMNAISCYYYARYFVQGELADVTMFSQAMGEPVLWAKTGNWQEAGSSGLGGGVKDYTFDIDYISKASQTGSPLKLRCPSQCDVFDYGIGFSVPSMTTCNPDEGDVSSFGVCCTSPSNGAFIPFDDFDVATNAYAGCFPDYVGP